MAKFLDSLGLQYLINKIKTLLNSKQNSLSTGEGLNLSNDTLSTTAATNTEYGAIKLNSEENITLSSSGQLKVGGRLGQSTSTTGIYSPNTINPQSIGNGSMLITEASGTRLGNKSFAVSTGSNISLKTSAAAGATQYVVSNTYENRIICAAAVGGIAALNESSAATTYVNITSVQIGGSSFVPNSSANDSSNNIVITVDKSVNPNSSVSQIRVYANEGYSNGFSNLFVGQQVGGIGGASIIVGQKVYSASGNACAIVGASIYNAGNGNAIFGRQHISRKNRSFLAGTGHDTTNGPSEGVAAFGSWSSINNNTVFAIGNGTNHTNRSNIFEITTSNVNINDSVNITGGLAIVGTLSLGRVSATTQGNYSAAIGNTVIASGTASQAEGTGTTANRKSQHTFGEFNIVDTTGTGITQRGAYIEIVGNGTDDATRSNACTLDWNGNEWLAGGLILTTPDGTAKYKITVDNSGNLITTAFTDY